MISLKNTEHLNLNKLNYYGTLRYVLDFFMLCLYGTDYPGKHTAKVVTRNAGF